MTHAFITTHARIPTIQGQFQQYHQLPIASQKRMIHNEIKKIAYQTIWATLLVRLLDEGDKDSAPLGKYFAHADIPSSENMSTSSYNSRKERLSSVSTPNTGNSFMCSTISNGSISKCPQWSSGSVSRSIDSNQSRTFSVCQPVHLVTVFLKNQRKQL